MTHTTVAWTTAGSMEPDSMQYLDLEAFGSAPVRTDPFPHMIVPGFVHHSARAAVNRDFPPIAVPGSLPLGTLKPGPTFRAFINACQDETLTAAFANKFGIDLTGRPTMVTVRGQCRRTDGKVHTDSRTKLVTVLIYMNPSWETADGRLRLLRSPNLDDVATEVPPEEGTLLAFLNGPDAWHGHTAFEGPRRAIQLNWVTDAGVVRREQRRHRVSAILKRLNPFR